MARGTTLGAMLPMLRAECRYATDSGVGQSKNPALKYMLRKSYAMLYDLHEWPFLSGHWEDKPIVAGSRYYDFPASINMEGVASAAYKWQSTWLPLAYGFDTDVYNQFDSDNNERADPAQAWRLYSDTQFEVWPIPATDGVIRFTGKRAMGNFTDETDVCLLDDYLVVLYAAAEELSDKKRGETLRSQAEARLAEVKASSNKLVSFRPGSDAHRARRPFRTIVVAR